MTIRDYCRQHALRETSFYAWRRIIRERDRSAPPAVPAVPAVPASGEPRSPAKPAAARPANPPVRKPAFLPVTIVDTTALGLNDSAIDIHLASGHRVCLRPDCDRALLADLLAMLAQPSAAETPPC